MESPEVSTRLLVGAFALDEEHDDAAVRQGGLFTVGAWPAGETAGSDAVGVGGPDGPTWMVRGREGTPSAGRLYAALHLEEGALAVLEQGPDGEEPDDAGWTVVQQVPAGGSATCHADVSPDGTWVAAASYASATLTLVPVQEDGLLGEPIPVQAPEGSGPVPERQSEPHLHFVHFLDEDRLLVTDLGADRILEYSVQAVAAGEQQPRAVHHLPPGTGPRHLVPLRCGVQGVELRLAVVGELDSRLHLLDVPAGEPGPEGFPAAATVPTHLPDEDPSAKVPNQPSHAVPSADGALLYVANRGRNSIGVIRVEDELPELIAEAPCGGDWPRHLTLVQTPEGPGLAVALERAGAVVHLPLGPQGIPQAPAARVQVPQPGFILPL